MILAAGYFMFKREAGRPLFLTIRSERDGCWGFPKGHADEGEDLRSAARRELAEETGITDFKSVPAFETTISYKVEEAGGRFDKSVTYYLAEVPPDTLVKLSEEHTEFRWAAASEVETLLAFDNLREAFRGAVSAASGK